jgi:methionine-rich copper-binding protein CopC
MSPRRRLRAATAALLLAVLAPLAAFAHSALKRSDPPSGSVLKAPPPSVVLEFNEPARLTSVVAVGADQSERKLEFAPAGSATSFTVAAPALSAGRNELRWKALSKDGHPVSGTVVLVVEPNAAGR